MYSDIIIPENKLNGARVGQKVFVTISDWTDAKKLRLEKLKKYLVCRWNTMPNGSYCTRERIHATFPPHILKEAQKFHFLALLKMI